MNTTLRREKIAEILDTSTEYVSASKLTEVFGVSRQIIVSDIALLRANGKNIIATQRGYIIEKGTDLGKATAIICRHTKEQIREELYAIVDGGGIVSNVIVEHPLYGQISADLKISSRFDADEFVEKAQAFNASQLSDLTDGVHIHTIRVPSQKALDKILLDLNQKGILIEQRE